MACKVTANRPSRLRTTAGSMKPSSEGVGVASWAAVPGGTWQFWKHVCSGDVAATTARQCRCAGDHLIAGEEERVTQSSLGASQAQEITWDCNGFPAGRADRE